MRAENNSIDDKKCIRCSRCVNICPEKHLDMIDLKIVEIDDPIHACIQCGHCMSVCPSQAIIIKGFDYAEFENLPDILPVLDDYLLLLKARRSCRQYQDKPVPTELIDRIVRVASLAPMGIPPHKVEILVISGREKIEEFIPLALKELKNWDYGFSNPFIKLAMRFMMSGPMMHQMEEQILPLAKGMIEGGKQGQDYLTYGAPAMMLFHSTKFEAEYQENCIIAKIYAMIAAEGLGLGSCIIGMIPPMFRTNKKLREMYDIPKDNDVVGCLILGYPKATHNRSIHRDFKSVKWV